MRHDRAGQRSLVRTVWAFLQIVGHVLAPWRRRWRTQWGTLPEERSLPLPGDDLVPDPNWGYNHAVSIAAPPEVVWPWIAQIGQGRGGFYSFELLENMFGCRITNAETILGGHQTVAIGDEIRLHPSVPALRVAVVEIGRALALLGAPVESAVEENATLWAFHVLDDGPGRSRLVERGKTTHGTSLADRLSFSPLLVEPIGFVMSREMLLGIKERAEAAVGE
ncbi:MAG: hypothetical protein ABFS21_11330 [Actinomycetota bacterium]